MSDVLSSLQEAELGVRRFLETKHSIFLFNYRKSVDIVPKQLDRLEQDLAHEPARAEFMVNFRSSTSKSLGILADATNKSGLNYDSKDNINITYLITNLMNELRRQIDNLDAADDRAGSATLSRLRFRIYLAVGTTICLLGVMTVLAQAALRETRRRAALARFLPAEIAQELADGEPALINGTTRTMAVAFVDFRGSTRLAEHLRPDEFMGCLSTFRRQISEAAQSSSGIIDKFIGDGALVLFGLSGSDQAAANAILFSENMIKSKTEAFVAGNKLINIDFGMGIHYGFVFCGVLGGEERVKFTVLGDTVNVASRLKSLTESLGASIVISEEAINADRIGSKNWGVSDQILPGRQAGIKVFYR